MTNKEKVPVDTNVNNYGFDLKDLGGAVWNVYDTFYTKINGLIALSKQFDITKNNLNYVNLDGIIEIIKRDLADSWGNPIAAKLIPQLVYYWNKNHLKHNILKVNDVFIIII